MASRRMKRISMDLDGKAMRYFTLLIALSLFLTAVYYFGLKNMLDLGFGASVFCGILPLLMCILCVILVQFLRWNAPGMYGMIAAVYCAMMILGSLFTAGFFQIVIGLAFYAIAAGVVLVTTGGSIASRGFCSAMFIGCIVMRVIFALMSGIGIFEWIAEFAVYAAFGAMSFIPSAIKVHKA